MVFMKNGDEQSSPFTFRTFFRRHFRFSIKITPALSTYHFLPVLIWTVITFFYPSGICLNRDSVTPKDIFEKCFYES